MDAGPKPAYVPLSRFNSVTAGEPACMTCQAGEPQRTTATFALCRVDGILILIPLAGHCDSDPNFAACAEIAFAPTLAAYSQAPHLQLRSSHLPQQLLAHDSRGAAALHGTLTSVFVRAGARRSFRKRRPASTIPTLQPSTSIRSFHLQLLRESVSLLAIAFNAVLRYWSAISTTD